MIDKLYNPKLHAFLLKPQVQFTLGLMCFYISIMSLIYAAFYFEAVLHGGL